MSGRGEMIMIVLFFNVGILHPHSLKHPNLVDMVGFSCDGQYPCLVYVCMANGSVLDRLACMVK